MMNPAPKNSLFFYQGDKLVTVKQGDQQHAIFRNAEQPLAELSTVGGHAHGLLATDDKGSVLAVHSPDEKSPST